MKKYEKQCWFNHNITCILLKYRNEHSSLHTFCNNTHPNNSYPVKKIWSRESSNRTAKQLWALKFTHCAKQLSPQAESRKKCVGIPTNKTCTYVSMCKCRTVPSVDVDKVQKFQFHFLDFNKVYLQRHVSNVCPSENLKLIWTLQVLWTGARALRQVTWPSWTNHS